MTSLSLNRLSCFLLNNNDVVVVWDRNYYVVVILAAKSKVLTFPFIINSFMACKVNE